MTNNEKLIVIGDMLLNMGFRAFTKYLFNIIENKSFEEEILHTNLFNSFDKIYNQELIRVILNLPPRSGKTTLIKYFIVYALTKNPKSNFIYTSYSQDLVSKISQEIKVILENPVYKIMFNCSNNEYQDINTVIVDEFWKEYLYEANKKAIYTNKKIVTKAGGEILFASIGSQITGFGAGTREDDKFSGFLVIDDGNKPADIRSETLREKTKLYFEETLLSRLNNSKVPIINIQQRLHLEDLSGFLIDKYKFDVIKEPLLNEEGICTLPRQYNDERIKELKQNESVFSAQFQQEPVEEGGNLFKLDWFKFTDNIPTEKEFDYRFIVGDTAMKDGENNDFTVFSYWGAKKIDKKPFLFLIDMKRVKIQAIDIKDNFYSWFKKCIYSNEYGFRKIWIEDKVSGSSLLQDLRRTELANKIPADKEIKEMFPRNSDKVSRANNIITNIDKINKNVIFNSRIECIEEFKKEILSFPKGKHDDTIDNLIDACKIGLYEKRISIYDVL